MIPLERGAPANFGGLVPACATQISCFLKRRSVAWHLDDVRRRFSRNLPPARAPAIVAANTSDSRLAERGPDRIAPADCVDGDWITATAGVASVDRGGAGVPCNVARRSLRHATYRSRPSRLRMRLHTASSFRRSAGISRPKSVPKWDRSVSSCAARQA